MTKHTEPHNLCFWKMTLKKPDEINDFLVRGNKRQKEEIKNVLLYLKRFDPDFFEDVEGENILEKIK